MMMRMISMMVIIVLALMGTAKADQVFKGFIVKTDDGKLMACALPVGAITACWQLYGNPSKCTAIMRAGDKLACDVKES